MNIETIKALCPEFAELLEMESKISKAPWHTVAQIWLPRGCDTYVISGHYDPHVGRPVFSDYGGNDDIEWPEIAANCEFTAKVRNALIPLITALAEARQAMEWRPISEAPKDETTVDLWVVGTPFPDKPKHNTGFRLPDCWYCPDEQAWVTNDPFSEIEIINRPGINITHFRYLPTPPSVKEG